MVEPCRNASRDPLAFGILALLGLAASAQSAAPPVQSQVPGYYRLQLGRFEITALFDGAIELDSKVLRNADASELQQLLSRMFVGNPKMQTAVNAYLINTGDHLVLVDAGAAKLFGPTLGFVRENLQAAGYTPNPAFPSNSTSTRSKPSPPGAH